VDENEKASISALISDGWDEIETLVVYGRQPVYSHFDRDLLVMPDPEEMADIAAATGGNSRLYKDPRVPRKVAEKERVRMALKASNVIAQSGGFLTWEEDEGMARISTIAVSPDCQRQGIGGNLLRAWMTMMVGKALVVAGTQSTNPATSFYEGYGFQVIGRGKTFHKWQ